MRRTTLGVSLRAYLGHQVQRVRILMQRLLDDLVRDVRTVEITGVDLIDTESDYFA